MNRKPPSYHAAKARKLIRQGRVLGRAFDDCFEHDGASRVVALLCRTTEHDKAFARQVVSRERYMPNELAENARAVLESVENGETTA
ncbi:MAG TPA: hypothetical protein VM487_19325 [Phycisphaerae bacterium]|nr:hypothetical protein [Phycisphaerae bacterium]